MKALCVLAVGACHYHPGSFADWVGPYSGTRLTLGCVELSVGRTSDDLAEGPVVEYAFGNRCDHAVTLDLASARVRVRDAGGQEREIAPYDPRHELRPATLYALWAARERIEYGDGGDVALVSLCVDVGGVNASEPRSERWVCEGDR